MRKIRAGAVKGGKTNDSAAIVRAVIRTSRWHGLLLLNISLRLLYYVRPLFATNTSFHISAPLVYVGIHHSETRILLKIARREEIENMSVPCREMRYVKG